MSVHILYILHNDNNIVMILEYVFIIFFFLQVMKSFSKLSKIFLTAMVHELYKTGMGETTFEKVSFLSFSLNLCVLSCWFGDI